MINVDDFVSSMLHAESRYDPVKAHEYYLKTRELQGRRSGTALKSTRQKEGWAFTKSEVTKEKVQSLDIAAQDHKAAVELLRTKGVEQRKAISDKIRNILDRITASATQQRAQISDKVQAEIDKLPAIPKGISKEEAAKLSAKRSEDIAKIRGNASNDRKSLTTSEKTDRSSTTNTGSAERQAVATEIKGSLDKARTTYETAKETIKAQFESDLNSEFNAIKTNVR